MNNLEALQEMRKAGIIFDGARGFITPETVERLARDAALVTPANSGVPAIMTTYIDPTIVDILTAPTRAQEIFGEQKEGDWTNTHAMFKTVEAVGESTPYTDYGNGAMADINVTYPVRQNYLAQTHIRYGQQEMAVSGLAMINLASEKQRSAATIIKKESNKFYLYGVANREIYGLLNDPNLPAAITPASVDSKTLWKDKTTQAIYNDILALASELFTNSMGNIDEKADLVLVVSPAVNVLLGKATDFNVSVKDMLKNYFDRLSIVVLPELDAESGDSVMLIARDVNGAPTAKLGYSDKMRTLPLITNTSWFEQKFVFGTYGAIIFRPYAIATMTGV